jgi:hypothetical protein
MELDVDGYRVRAFLKHVSPWGPRWGIEIDGVQTDGGLDGRIDDTEEFVRQHMIHQTRFKLGGRGDPLTMPYLIARQHCTALGSLDAIQWVDLISVRSVVQLYPGP